MCCSYSKNKLIGTISDSDIRKVIIKNINIKSSKIKKFYNRNLKYLEQQNIMSKIF